MKRLFDLLVTVFLLLIFLPLLFILLVFIRLKLGSPIFFKQERPGLDAKPFTMYKFRTMTNERDAGGKLLIDEKRLNKFGVFLRSTSLDEMPELWNVLKGEMSLVGPRPLLMEYLPLYNEEQARRHKVKPGITGWAQIKGRNSLSWDEKFKLDQWYVDNRSQILDLRILWETIFIVLRREGVAQKDHVTMEPFQGNET